MKLDVAWAFLSWWDDWNMFMIVENAKWTQMIPHVTWIGFWRYRCIHWSQILTWRRSKLKHDYKQVAQAQSVSLKPLQPNQLCRAPMLGKSTNKPQPQFANWCWKLSNHLKSLEPFVKWTPLCTWLVVRDSNMRQCQLPWALGCTAVNINSSASYYSISHLRNPKNIKQHVTAKSLKVAGKPPW